MKIAVHRAMSSRGPSEGPGAGAASTMPTDDAIFIPLCGLHKAKVIPNAVRNLRMWPVDISACARTVDSSSLGSSE